MKTRKMIIFIVAMATVTTILLFGIFKGINFTGESITTILSMILLFSAVMGGANIAEHYTDALNIKYKNGVQNGKT